MVYDGIQKEAIRLIRICFPVPTLPSVSEVVQVKSMQRSGTEAITIQIQHSKPKREIT